MQPGDRIGGVEGKSLAIIADDFDAAFVGHLGQQVGDRQTDVTQGAGLLFDGLAKRWQAIHSLGEILYFDAGLIQELLVDQVYLNALVPGELVMFAIYQLLVPQIGEVLVHHILGHHIVQLEQQTLSGVIGNPTFRNGEVDDIWGILGSKCVAEIIRESGLVVFPFDCYTRISLVEAGNGALDIVIKCGGEIVGPEANFGIRFNIRNNGFGVGAGGRGYFDDFFDNLRLVDDLGFFHHDGLFDWLSWSLGSRSLSGSSGASTEHEA